MKSLYTLVMIAGWTISDIGVSENSTKILAFGDSGTGSTKQQEVADSMRKVCDNLGCDFGVMLGDNFYEDGVGHVDDRQFYDKFEKPYSPIGIPFYVSLGNHDDRGDTEAQVEYTKRSRWWKMPAKYYEKIIGDVQLIAIDSNDFDREQREFVAEKLRNSSSRWKIVFGHHPIHSYGMHGDTSRLRKDLLPLLCEYGSMYLAGHDHDLQVLRADCGLPLVISGAAAKLRSTKKGSRSLWASSQYGFARLEIKRNHFTVYMHDEGGKVVHESTFNHRDSISSDYEEINDREEVSCAMGRLLNGFRYDHVRDEHVTGIFCTDAEGRVDTDSELVAVDDLSGKEYDVLCPEGSQAVSGITYDSSGDDHIEGLICRERLSQHPEKDPYYVKISDSSSKKSDVRCLKENEVVVGVRYDDSGDDHIEGIFCQ